MLLFVAFWPGGVSKACGGAFAPVSCRAMLILRAEGVNGSRVSLLAAFRFIFQNN